MRRALALAALATVPGVVQADWYAGGALGHVRAKAEDFRFHNPVGAGPLNLNIGGNYVPMQSVNDRDSASTWSVRGGYLFAGTPWRLEADFTRRAQVSFRGFANFAAIGGGNFQQDLRVRSQSYLLMGYYDHALDRDWSLYGGAGIGVARNRSDGRQGDNQAPPTGGNFPARTNSNTAWAAALGVSRKLTDRLTGDLGYRYVDLGKADTGTTNASFAAVGMNANERLEAKLRSHEFRLGLNYRF